MKETGLTVLKGIARRCIVKVRYNGQCLNSAHLMFERHGDLSVRAVSWGKNRRDGDGPRFGLFKLAGLADAELLEATFEPLQPQAIEDVRAARTSWC